MLLVQPLVVGVQVPVLVVLYKKLQATRTCTRTPILLLSGKMNIIWKYTLLVRLTDMLFAIFMCELENLNYKIENLLVET